MIYDLRHLRRAAEIAANTKCWIGIGCVIAGGGKILVKAWNETLPGEEYCREFRKGPTLAYAKVGPYHTNAGCIRHDLGLSQGQEIEKCCSIHAEVNAIAAAARQGIAISGAAMFVTSFPCLICIRSIIAAGIKKVVYMNNFYKPHHEELFIKNGIKIERVPEEKVWEIKK
jgi:dCMP deaminase